MKRWSFYSLLLACLTVFVTRVVFIFQEGLAYRKKNEILFREARIKEYSWDPDAPGRGSTEQSGYTHPFLKNIWISHVEGTKNKVIYGTNYSSLGILLAPSVESAPHLIPMLDFRGHLLNNGETALNLGMVFRYLFKNCSYVFGVNAYGDFREGSWGNFYGYGLGIETLSERWDLRVNGYFPVGKREHDLTWNYNYPGGWFAQLRQRECALYGGNAEVGYKLFHRDALLYCGIGPYYFSGQGSGHVAGGIVRVRPQFRNILALDLGASYDNQVKYNFQAAIVLSLPLYSCSSWKKSKGGSSCASNCFLYQPVERFQVMQLKKRDHWFYNWSVAGSNR